MNCSRCHKKNIKKANYCRYCGKKFSQEEKEKARNTGFIALIKKFDDWYDLCTLKKITDNWIFKIALLGSILSIGLYSYFTNGNELKILNSESYQVSYNEKKEEFYIFLKAHQENDELQLNLFIPNRIDYIYINNYDENENLIEKEKINKKDKIVLKTNITDNNYYLISDNEEEVNPLKIFVYYEVSHE